MEIARLIDSGALRAGQALPSSRELAAQLGLSRDTVVNAYRELNRLGYTFGAPPKGTYVMQEQLDKPPADKTRIEAQIDPALLSAFARQMLAAEYCHPSSTTYAGLNYGAVPRSALPMRKWRSTMQEMCKPETFRKLEYKPDGLGRSELRQAIAGYLYRTKGIECDWKQVAIFSISSGMINIVLKLLLEPGAAIAVEEPGYGAIKNIAKTQALSLAPTDIDDNGLNVHSLNKHIEPVKLIYVTAGHHDPTGTIMSQTRKKELISWAKNNNAWIIDDDYDGHFYYEAPPQQSLWSMQPDSNVIYSSTFWQILYPLTTIGYAVVPKKLISAVTAAIALQTTGFADAMVQLTLSKLLEDGYLEYHVRRTQRIFSKRRVAITYDLKRLFGPAIEIQRQSGGCCFVVRLRSWSESEVDTAALKSGFPLVPTSAYYLGKPRQHEYLVNFSLYTEEVAAAKLKLFADVLKQGSSHR